MKHFFEKKVIIPILSLTLAFPLLSEARTIREIAESIADFLLDSVLKLLLTIATVSFVWGVIEFIRNADNSDARKKGKQKIIWGIIGLFVMLSFLGLTGVLSRTFFNSGPVLPQFYEK